jgi:hypothetical protein
LIEIGALHLKTALLYYYRFKRQYVCVDECHSCFGEIADILVDTKKHHYEIEIKISKGDLNAEKKKMKHKYSEDEKWTKRHNNGANKFYLCVPTDLIPYTKKWIQEINPKYGLIEFDINLYQKHIDNKRGYWLDKYICIRKNASMLHKNYNKHLSRNMSKRLSSALINAYTHNMNLIERLKNA